MQKKEAGVEKPLICKHQRGKGRGGVETNATLPKNKREKSLAQSGLTRSVRDSSELVPIV